jgi:hypothetical protein
VGAGAKVGVGVGVAKATGSKPASLTEAVWSGTAPFSGILHETAPKSMVKARSIKMQRFFITVLYHSIARNGIPNYFRMKKEPAQRVHSLKEMQVFSRVESPKQQQIRGRNGPRICFHLDG